MKCLCYLFHFLVLAGDDWVYGSLLIIQWLSLSFVGRGKRGRLTLNVQKVIRGGISVSAESVSQT